MPFVITILLQLVTAKSKMIEITMIMMYISDSIVYFFLYLHINCKV